VLREKGRVGIDDIDTSDFYRPSITNRLRRKALHPSDADLTIVTEVGAYRDEAGAEIRKRDTDVLRRSMEDNRRAFGLDRMAVVDLRMGGSATISPRR
jgi:aryl-alcohol dehydrogenase-like predicted oxidoreductase